MKRSFLVLLAILIAATILRVYQLDRVPPSLFGDEVDVGYQAYSLLKTGKDLYENSWPTLIHSLAEYRAPLFIYSAIPFIGIFGLNEWGVRLPSVVFGVLGVFGIFLLTRRLFNEKIGLLSAGFLTISPWHMHYSRAAFEVTVLLVFMIFGTYFFLKGMERKYLLLVSAILFGLTPYIYSTAVVFMPLLILILCITYRDWLKILLRQANFVNWIPACLPAGMAFAGMTILIILTPYLIQTFSGKAGERFNIISVFGNKDLIDKVQFAQQNEQQSGGFQRFFHNKGLEWGRQISMNYLRAYSPEFLFLNGDPNSRHSVHEMGQMYLFEAALLIFGGLGLLGKLGVKKKNRLIFGWLLISPIPAALTYDGGFHATRNFLMLFPLMVILALGVEVIWEKRKSKAWKYFGLALIILIVINVIFYMHRYSAHYPAEQWRAWHFGFKEAMQYVKENESNYQNIYINNTYEPSLIRFLFWTAYDPNKFHKEFVSDKSTTYAASFEGFQLENKYYFGDFTGPFEEIIEPLSLYVLSARDDITNPQILTNPRINLLKTIYSPTNEPIFFILTGTNEIEL